MEIECKPAHNFHGEPVDVRACNDESDFVQKSVKTIEEYLNHSRGLAFLPVIANVPEDLLSHISSVLTAKEIKNGYCESLYIETNDKTLKALPSVYFFDINGNEGLEFAVVVILLYGNSSVERKTELFFHEIFTRACAKLVIVYAIDKKWEKQEQKKQMRVNSEKVLKTVLESTEPNSLVFLVGTNFQFNFITPISQSDLKNQNISLPKVEGIQHFKGPNHVIILQKEDLYRRKDVEELIAVGLKKILIVGGREIISWQENFYFLTSMILSCDLYSGHFESASKMEWDNGTVDEFSAQIDHFLNKTENRNVFDLQKLSLVDKKLDFDKLLCSNEPYFKWENWNQKAKEFDRLHLSSSRVKFIYNECLKFLNKKMTLNNLCQRTNIASSLQNLKVLNKIANSLLKQYLSEILKPSYILENLTVAPGELYSFQFFAFQALEQADFLVKFHPRNVKTFHRIYRVMEIVRAKQANGVQAKHVVIEDELKHGEHAAGLRHLKVIENFQEPNLLQKCDLYSLQREDYEKENSSNKRNAKNEQLAEIACELSTLFLAHIKEKEIKEDSIQTRLQSFQSILTFVIHQPIRFALEALEWNLTHKPALEALNESFLFFAIILNEVDNISTKIEKRKTLHGKRF